MAQMLEVKCGDCGTEEVQLDGPVMAGYQPRCDQCGNTRLVPWTSTAGDAGAERLSGEAKAGAIADEAGPCGCGGRFSVDAPLRCSVCRSTDVSTTTIGSAD